MEVADTQGFSRNSALRTILACFSSELESLGTGDIAHLEKVGKPDDLSSVTRLQVVKKSINPHKLSFDLHPGKWHASCGMHMPTQYNLHKCLKNSSDLNSYFLIYWLLSGLPGE